MEGLDFWEKEDFVNAVGRVGGFGCGFGLGWGRWGIRMGQKGLKVLHWATRVKYQVVDYRILEVLNGWV